MLGHSYGSLQGMVEFPDPVHPSRSRARVPSPQPPPLLASMTATPGPKTAPSLELPPR